MATRSYEMQLRWVFGAIVLAIIACAPPQEVVYNIPDECGPIHGQILHSVKDESTCRIRCRGHCQSLDYEFSASAFQDRGTRCHLCNCTCIVVED
jgi:hypothetical protein